MAAQAVNEVGGDNGPLLQEGDLVGGRYRVERCLGGGGMASVFLATHEGLDQPVAVKVVSPAIRELPPVDSATSAPLPTLPAPSAVQEPALPVPSARPIPLPPEPAPPVERQPPPRVDSLFEDRK